MSDYRNKMEDNIYQTLKNHLTHSDEIPDSLREDLLDKLEEKREQELRER